MKNKAVIVGAGIWGCTLARRLAEMDYEVTILEQRALPGGNARSVIDTETGIEIHAYGSHIFHTHIPEVWNFINRFVKFNGYQHKVLAQYQGKKYILPIGLSLINKFFNLELTPIEVNDFLKDQKNQQAIFDAFIRGYTSKQWGMPPESIDDSIIKRIPIRSNYDVNYFKDYNQGIPIKGYGFLFEQLLNHDNIKIICNHEFDLYSKYAQELISKNIPIFYSGPIDKLFKYKFGTLPWRSLRFETETLNIQDYQGTSVVNFTEASVPYTRIHEFKHYHPENQEVMQINKTIIMREYPIDWKIGDEPYYPINNSFSQELLQKYINESKNIPNLKLGGRLGTYKYLDMDQAMESALNIDVK